MTLTADERARYDRHLIIPELSAEAGKAQARRRSGRGGWWSGIAALLYLAAAGVGRLGIVDHDKVELSNLNRQTLHTTADVGMPQDGERGGETARSEPGGAARSAPGSVRTRHRAELVAGYDVVITAVDNFAVSLPAQRRLRAGAQDAGRGTILRFVGLAMTIKGGESACYRCVFPERPADGAPPGGGEAGVFGPVPGVIGAMQAVEAIEVICGFGPPSTTGSCSSMRRMTFQETPMARDPDCPVCGPCGHQGPAALGAAE